MKKSINSISIVIVLISIGVIGFGCNGTKKHTENTSKLNTLSGLSADIPEAIIRFLDDSTGLGYFKDGNAYIDNIDTLNFDYTHESGGLTYKMKNFKIEGSLGYYYLTMEGNNKDQFIKIAFPCFADIPDSSDAIPVNFENYLNMCIGVGCPTCSFILNENNNIDGCTSNCNHSVIKSITSQCNHTIVSNGGSTIYLKHIVNYHKYLL